MKQIILVIRMLLKDWKNNMYYLYMVLILSTISFTFNNIIYNPIFTMQINGQYYYESSSISNFVVFVVIGFAVVLAIYAYYYLLTKKANELMIIKMSGGSLKKMGLFLFVQNCIIIFIASILGLVLGFLLNPIVNYIIYNYLHVDYKDILLFPRSIIDAIILETIILIATTGLGIGYVYRNEIVNMSESNSDWTKDRRIIKFHPFFHMFLYIAGIVMFLTSKDVSGAAIAFSLIGCCGAYGLIKFKLCKVIYKKNRQKYHVDKIKNIANNNLIYSLKKGNILILGLLFCSTVMLSWTVGVIGNPKDFIVAFIAYIISIILLLSSTLCRYLVDLEKRNQEYQLLYKIGYTIENIKNIITKEISNYYFAIIGFSIIYILLIFLHPLLYQRITIVMALGILLFYIVAIIIMMSITISISIKSIQKEMRGK